MIYKTLMWLGRFFVSAGTTPLGVVSAPITRLRNLSGETISLVGPGYNAAIYICNYIDISLYMIFFY